MKYKGYIAQIEVDEISRILFGKVLDIKDVITFKGNTVNELEQLALDKSLFAMMLCT